MKLLLPQNIFSHLYENLINKENIDEVIYLPSAQISKILEDDEKSIGLIPTCDLLTHHELFISSKLGIAFDGLISSSYFYLNNNFGDEAKVHVYGDVTSNDLILSKILINERYDIDIELILDTQKRSDNIDNFLICGEENFDRNLFEKGISFADQVAEFLNLPYVNYITTSKNEQLISEINKTVSNIDLKLEDELDKILKSVSISDSAKEFINMNIGSIYFEMTENETDALNEIIKLPYYHGMTEEVHDLKFV